MPLLRGLPLLLLCGALQASPLTVTVTDERGRALGDAVVAVMAKGLHAQADPGTRAEMAQRQKMFQPSVLVVQTGTAVSFPNLDTVQHHVYSFSPIKTFEILLYAGTPAAPVVFDKPGVAVLGCNIHDTMLAYVAVVDTPLFARTDAKGQARLQVPAGDHQLVTWHPSLGADTPLQRQPLHMPEARSAVSVKLAAHKAIP